MDLVAYKTDLFSSCTLLNIDTKESIVAGEISVQGGFQLLW
jgi:hypothetical protein